MAKPIVVIYVPKHFPESGWDPSQVMNILNNTENEKTRSTNYWTEYYWFCFVNEELDTPELKVFYDKDFTPINFEELKKMIDEQIKKPGQEAGYIY